MTTPGENGDAAEDWASRATATVVGYVDQVRSATTGRALVASRYAVYVAAVALIAVVIVIMALIVLVRLVGSLTALVFPFIVDGEIWLSYLVLGSLFLLGGWFLWRKKEAAS